MVIAPYFNKPNQEQIYEHFRQVAESVSVNVILYNIPIFTGVNIEPETLARLARIGNVVAIKDEAELNPKQDRKRVVQGKSVSVRVDLGSRRSVKNKKIKTKKEKKK